jgi:hypothetical protein
MFIRPGRYAADEEKRSDDTFFSLSAPQRRPALKLLQYTVDLSFQTAHPLPQTVGLIRTGIIICLHIRLSLIHTSRPSGKALVAYQRPVRLEGAPDLTAPAWGENISVAARSEAEPGSFAQPRWQTYNPRSSLSPFASSCVGAVQSQRQSWGRLWTWRGDEDLIAVESRPLGEALQANGPLPWAHDIWHSCFRAVGQVYGGSTH